MSMHKDEHKKEERSQRGHSSTKANGLSLDWKTILCDQWSLTTPVPLSTGQSALFGLKVHGFVGGFVKFLWPVCFVCDILWGRMVV